MDLLGLSEKEVEVIGVALRAARNSVTNDDEIFTTIPDLATEHVEAINSVLHRLGENDEPTFGLKG